MTRYPLAWPDGWKRTPAVQRKEALFSKAGTKHVGDRAITVQHRLTVSDATQRVLYELQRLSVRDGDAIISTNLQLRLDGLPRSGQGEPSDPGVAVYWQRRDRPQVMAVDRYTRAADNLAAIAATLEAMRAIERHGGAQILDRAFTGFLALPAPMNWRAVLQLNGYAGNDLEPVRAQYVKLAKARHPDAGGSEAAMAELNAAWDLAEKELRRCTRGTL